MTGAGPDPARRRISVVLASWEGAAYIGEQLASILPQLSADDEIVVSDDCSSDDTVSRVRAFSDPRVRILLSERREGYVRNFQKAVQASQGEYLFFSDQDDVWAPRKVEALLSALQHSQCVASDAIVVDASLNTLHASWFRLRGARSFSAAALLLRPSIVGATMACRRSFAQSLMPFPAGAPHDFWLSLNAALRGELRVIDEPLILYRRHAGVASASATARRRPLRNSVIERLTILCALMRTLLQAQSHSQNQVQRRPQ